MALKAFISYSTTDKVIAGHVKSILDDYHIDAFLAHEDIHVSQDWKDRIVEELNRADIFIPLLSKAFKTSDWAPQEIGIIFTRREGVCFIPLSLDGTIPFGFISHIQGKPIPTEAIPRSLLVDPLVARFPRDLIPTMIQHLSGARGWREAEALMLPLVPHFDKFNDEEIEAFVTASTENGEIWFASDCKTDYLPKFIKMHRATIPPEKLEPLEYQVTAGHWWEPKADAGAS